MVPIVDNGSLHIEVHEPGVMLLRIIREKLIFLTEYDLMFRLEDREYNVV